MNSYSSIFLQALTENEWWVDENENDQKMMAFAFAWSQPKVRNLILEFSPIIIKT